MISPHTRPSWSALPMFFDDSHRGLGAVCRRVLTDGDVALHPDPAEVAYAYRIGLHELQRSDSPRFVSIPESDRPVVQLPMGRNLIHAPTGAVLVQFRWVALDGRLGERVHTFEQPVFAWK